MTPSESLRGGAGEAEGTAVVDTGERVTKAVPRRDAKAQTEVLLAAPVMTRAFSEPELGAGFSS